MKEKITKISLFCIIIILAMIGLYRIADYEVKTMSLESSNLKADNYTPTLAEGEQDPNSYSYDITINEDTEKGWQVTENQHNDWYIPVQGDKQIFCIQPGAEIKYLNSVDIAHIMTHDGETHYSAHGCAETPHEGEKSYPIYKMGETKDLPPAAAYIISDPNASWEEKQNALWHLRDNDIDDGLIKGNGDPGHDLGNTALLDEANDYYEYDKLVRDKGLQPKDNTDLNKVYSLVDQNEGTYIVGPFNIDYTNGIYGDIAFSGISNMTVVGYNSKGEKVRDDIEIESIYIDDGTGVYGEPLEIKYFTPDEELKTDKAENQVYPNSGENFEVKFKDPNAGLSSDDPNRITSVTVKVKFQYMLAYGKYTILKGTRYEVSYYPHAHIEHQDPNYVPSGFWYTDRYGGRHWVETGHLEYKDCYSCTTTGHLDEYTQQDLMVADAIRVIYEEELEVGFSWIYPPDGENPPDTPDTPDNPPEDTPPGVNITMDLGGKVWEDVPAGKESTADGKYGDGDRDLANVKVTLYEEDGTIATLLSDPNEEGLSDEEIMLRINPTLTDDEGNYLFIGLDAQKKYYVEFEYNGQVYLPTDYNLNISEYNTDAWKITSKGTENESSNGDEISRDDYNERFKEIGSSPKNYQSTDSLSSGALTSGYNESFSQYDLMGFEMTESGDYQQGTILIDCFYTIEGGEVKETDEFQEGVISQKIKEYIKENKEYPDDSALRNIYSEIAGGDTQMWRKLQFIEDCKMQSYTQGQGQDRDLYPIFDYPYFIINKNTNEPFKSAKEAQEGSYDTNSITLDGQEYKALYPGQFFVNQGLWRRQEVDLALRKDVVYAATTINGKTEVYTYNNRTLSDSEQKELAELRAIYEQDRNNKAAYNNYLAKLAEIEEAHGDEYWEIQLRMRDYGTYYGGIYNRQIYPADYSYVSGNTNQSGKDLELYVTYKITVRNSSTSIISQITEVVDYYDKEYEYMQNLSWVMYGEDVNSKTFSAADYYNMIEKASIQNSSKQKNINSSDTSKYGSDSASDLTGTYNAVYIKGIADKKLDVGEEAYIYLTFKVNKDGNGIILDNNEDDAKRNYAEINGYTTYYADGTQLPNSQTKGSSDAAGLIDIDSTPGNLCSSDLQGNKYEKNFEDDTDRAKGLKVSVDDSLIRSITGVVWEDERTENVSNAMIGDGVRQDNEIGISRVTVKLVEKLDNGNEYEWYKTTSGSDGKYEFATDASNNKFIIPGNYVIRFVYGDNDDCVSATDTKTSYNGQDFKCTVYQKDMKSGTELASIDNEYYDIKENDKSTVNLSDAKDIWSRREEVNNYSKGSVTNSLAETLASPYNGGDTSALKQNTYMTAETAIIVLEGEYTRTSSDGNNSNSNGSNYYPNGNDMNGKYVLENVDFGLTERPKAQLELDKRVTHIQVTLADGKVLFDTSDSTADLAWTAGTAYDLYSKLTGNKYEDYYGPEHHRYYYRTKVDDLVASKYVNNPGNGLIQVTMDEEFMHGARIKISYDLTVKNVGETDYADKEFYYKGTGANSIVKTSADVVLDYVANNLQYRTADDSEGIWNTVNVNNVVSAEGLNSALTDSVTKYNTIIKTEKLNKALTPKETQTVSLVLSQLITSENTDADRNYFNIAEITKVSNDVGRRMAFSIQGNQDPAEAPQEVDSSKAEEVKIETPFGIGETVVYITLIVAVLAILIVGVILIKKKVLKK